MVMFLGVPVLKCCKPFLMLATYLLKLEKWGAAFRLWTRLSESVHIRYDLVRPVFAKSTASSTAMH